MSQAAHEQASHQIVLEPHPAGLWCLSISSALYTFAFGTITSLLVLYFTESLKIPSAKAYSIFAAVMSLLFTLPLIGGYLSGKFGYKYATVVGGVFCLLGTILLGIHSMAAMYLGVAAFIVGNGLLTPAIYSMVGLLYSAHDGRRDSGYTIYYLIFNIGFVISTAGGGYLARYFGYNHAFLFSGIFLLCSIIVFLACVRVIKPHPGSSMAPQVSWRPSAIVAALFVACIIGIPICMALLEHINIDNALLWVLTIGACIVILWVAQQQKDQTQRLKLIAFLILCIISLSFWTLYMLEPSLLTIFIEKNVNRNVFGFDIPPSTYYGLDSFFVIILGIAFSWFWKYLSQRGKSIALPTKFASSLICMGIGYLIFVLGIFIAGKNGLTHSGWIVFGYALLASAELLISPIGLSMVGRLMPKGYDGLGMGIWQLFTGLSAIISGYLANMAVVPSSGTLAQTNPIFSRALLEIGLGTLVCGVVAIILIPFIKRLIKEQVTH